MQQCYSKVIQNDMTMNYNLNTQLIHEWKKRDTLKPVSFIL